VEIISGALDMKSKTVKDIMTKIEHVFMLPIDAVLDYDTMAEVEYHGQLDAHSNLFVRYF